MGDLLKMYSFSASSERRMRVSLILLMPLTATVAAGEPSDTTSAAAVFTGGALGSGAGVIGAVIAVVVATGASTTGASFFATAAGAALLGRMLFAGIPADGLDLDMFAATVSTLAGAGVGSAATGCAAIGAGAGGCTTGTLALSAAGFAGAGSSENDISTVPLVISGTTLDFGGTGTGVATATAGVVTAGWGAGAAGIGVAAGCCDKKMIDEADAAS